MDREPIKAIADILVNQMSIAADRIYLPNSLRALPTDENIFIALDVQTYPPFGMKREYQENKGVYTERQSVMIKQLVTIKVMSKNTDARTECYKVAMALNSTYSQQIQEKYGFHLSVNNNVQNRSFLEATARLNRFDTEVNVITAIKQTQAVDYYDTFNEDEIVFEG